MLILPIHWWRQLESTKTLKIAEKIRTYYDSDWNDQEFCTSLHYSDMTVQLWSAVYIDNCCSVHWLSIYITAWNLRYCLIVHHICFCPVLACSIPAPPDGVVFHVPDAADMIENGRDLSYTCGKGFVSPLDNVNQSIPTIKCAGGIWQGAAPKCDGKAFSTLPAFVSCF